MGLDQVVIERRLTIILSEREFLKSIKTQIFTEFLKDGKSQRSTAKAIETIAHCVIDIGSHIIAQNHWGISDSYRQILAKLAENKVISDSLAVNLQGLIAMRNILVHQYLDIDYEIIWESIDAVIEDAHSFVSTIRKYLANINTK